MIRSFAGCVVILFAVSVHADTIDLYILSGQSNLFENRVEPEHGINPALTATSLSIRYTFDDIYYETTTPWMTLRSRAIYSPVVGIGIGPEMSFATTIDAASANSTAFIKVWRGAQTSTKLQSAGHLRPHGLR
ncbi:MAG: hypothetical protein R3C45_11790 [Phycisphaerales bacterium]